MSAKEIDRWVAGLGQTFQGLIAAGVRINESLIPSPREGAAEEFISKPVPGIELWFQAKTMKLERIVVTLKGRIATVPAYKGELPNPFTLEMTKQTVRAKFGEPYQSKGPIKMPLIGLTGGWDAYRLHDSIHPNAEVAIQYLADQTVSGLSFCLLDAADD